MRILITRPPERAAATAARLQALGHEVVQAPLLALAPSGLAMPTGPFDALLVTSPGAFAVVAPGPALPSTIPVLAVGDHTADVARASGFSDVRSAAGDRRDLARLTLGIFPPGRRLLLAVGRERKEDLATLLADGGQQPVIWVCYHADAAPELPEHAVRALADNEIDCVMHYSPRSAAVFHACIEAAGLADVARRLAHVCISADAAVPLHLAGYGRLALAARPDEAGLLAALADLGAVHE